MNLNETTPTYTTPAETLSRKETLWNLFLQTKMTAFDESSTESLKTSIWRQSRQNKSNMYTSSALLTDKKPRKAMAKNS